MKKEATDMMPRPPAARPQINGDHFRDGAEKGDDDDIGEPDRRLETAMACMKMLADERDALTAQGNRVEWQETEQP